MITFERMRTAMVLCLMLALAVLCNLAPDESKPWHIAQLLMVSGVYWPHHCKRWSDRDDS